MTVRIINADCREALKCLPDASVHCCVTSPPYFGLRDYGNAAQIGLEPTPDEFVAAMVEVFREVRRVLRDDGTLWLNLGDSYAANQSNNGGCSPKSTLGGGVGKYREGSKNQLAYEATKPRQVNHGVKAKDLIGIPWKVAFALQADGWWLRQDIIWSKPNPMPESVTDRCTKAHEYIFLLSKSAQYYFDAAAIAEPSLRAGEVLDYTGKQKNNDTDPNMLATRPKNRKITITETRNKRDVWTVASQAYSEAHFATFPPTLIEPCILAGCPKGGTVLDPFGGAGTTGLVSDRLGRDAVLIELNPEYVALAERRMSQDGGMFYNLAAQ